MTLLRAAVVAVVMAFCAVGCSGGQGAQLGRQVLLPIHAPSGFSGVELISRGGSIIAAKGFSSSRPEPSAASTVFDIGSVAKSFTAAAVLQLVSNHRIRLTEHLSSVLPTVSRSDGDITISQLLAHTSGLPTYFASERTNVSERDAVRKIGRLPRKYPGQFRYSDAGYTLLAAIVQRVSGVPFRRYVEQHLLDPSGMTHTGWYGDRPPNDTTAAHSYVDGVDKGAAGQEASASWSTLGAGGMVSTATDLSRWAWALLDHRVLPASATKMLFAPRVRLPRSRIRASAAFGWITGKTPKGTQILVVGGGTDYGFTADLRIYPTLKTVTVVLSNDAHVPALKAAVKLGSAFPR